MPGLVLGARKDSVDESFSPLDLTVMWGRQKQEQTAAWVFGLGAYLANARL
jgi:hypothetical protein